jgi:hypothetical protein
MVDVCVALEVSFLFSPTPSTKLGQLQPGVWRAVQSALRAALPLVLSNARAGRLERLRFLRPATNVTEVERKKRGEKSAVIVERLVRVQLRAMGCERFELGIRHDAGEMILREGQGAIEIEEAIKWLRHENPKGAHIYVRPACLHPLSLIDDLSAEAIERMKAEGFEPAVIVETSPNNFQAWLNHGQVLEAARSTRAAKALVERFGGDPSSADWRHFGRLAGFTNPKRER